jgi:hypothetical protein
MSNNQAQGPQGLKIIASDLVNEDNKQWIIVGMTKQALDYCREGIAIKAYQLERDKVKEGEDVQPRIDFAYALKEEINTARGVFG